jgi:hypothetical protein
MLEQILRKCKKYQKEIAIEIDVNDIGLPKWKSIFEQQKKMYLD